MKSISAVLAAAFVGSTAAAVCAPADAGVVFTDLGPGGSYDSGSSWAAWGSAPAYAFVAATGGKVSEIDIALTPNFGPGAAGATVSLWTDVGGSLGSELGAWTIGAPASGLAEITGISGVSLTAGDSYFLQAAGAWGEPLWHANNQGVTSDMLLNGSPFASGETTGAFQVLSAAVPEPSTWAVMLLGLAVVGAALRMGRRKTETALAAA